MDRLSVTVDPAIDRGARISRVMCARYLFTTNPTGHRRRGDRITTIFTAAQNVCFWHKADIDLSGGNVRYWGKADIVSRRDVCF